MKREYVAVCFTGLTESQKDLLSGILPEAGFDGFEEVDAETFTAYAESSRLRETRMEELLRVAGVVGTRSVISEKNWNEEWEKSFAPVVIPGKIAVRASFHPAVHDVDHEIVITPKMSFGTGHHATTCLMMEEMLRQNFSNKKVLDYGTGTGILAILAEKLGAVEIDAVDNDSWSFENSRENITKNGCQKINLSLGESWDFNKKFDILLANINKGVILDNRDNFLQSMVKDGFLILSGLLINDLPEIEDAFENKLGRPLFVSEKNNWISLTFRN